MGEAFLLACGLVLLIEGLMPFASPARWRQVFEQVLRLGDGQIRFIGLCSILLGLLILGLAGA
ncbi:MAG: DUF2065 domain-containing protein [Burkholderiaceae bacterium]|nr:DUF2065 domain-containing protein [Burkholderiaceae bacterium]